MGGNSSASSNWLSLVRNSGRYPSLLPTLGVGILLVLGYQLAHTGHHPGASFLARPSSSSALLPGAWTASAHRAGHPDCAAVLSESLRPYNASVTTALSSYHRSGNSFIRHLIERSSGYYSTANSCDVNEIGVCDLENRWLIKSHWPVFREETANVRDGLMNFQRVVHTVRNPLDTLYSFYHMQKAGRAGMTGIQLQTVRVDENGLVGHSSEGMILLEELLDRWLDFYSFWEQAPFPSITVRYEDLRKDALPGVLSVLQFLLPAEDLPSLARVTCGLEVHDELDWYHSDKRAAFYSWELYDPRARTMILDKAKVQWCRLGYEQDLFDAHSVRPVDCAKLARSQWKGLLPAA